MEFRFFAGSKSATSNLYLNSVLMIYYSKVAQFYFTITPKVTLNGRHFSQCLCLLFSANAERLSNMSWRHSQSRSEMQPGPSKLQPYPSNQTLFSMQSKSLVFPLSLLVTLHSPTHSPYMISWTEKKKPPKNKNKKPPVIPSLQQGSLAHD